MSRFRDEVNIIPRPVWAISVLVWFAFFLMMTLIPIKNDPEVRQWPEAGKLALSILPGIPLAMLTLLIGYVYADAKRRGMRYVMWTFLAVLIPNAIGIILYFIMRDPLLLPCPNCGAPARPGFAFCQNCGKALSRACPQCRRAVEQGWSHCVHCGASLAA